jgi:hypothetical protein
MNALAVNVTEFSRGLSDYLNHVQYRGQVFDIERGKRVIARVSPASAADGFPIDQLDGFLSGGPQLASAERAAMAQDLRAVRAKLTNRADPWAS